MYEAHTDKKNCRQVVPPELRKSFRRRMQDLIAGPGAEAADVSNAGPTKDTGTDTKLEGLKSTTSTSPSSSSWQESSDTRTDQGSAASARPSTREILPGDATVKISSAEGQPPKGMRKFLEEAATRADDDPLNANDRINQYMHSHEVQKESAFKRFEKTLHYDPNAF